MVYLATYSYKEYKGKFVGYSEQSLQEVINMMLQDNLLELKRFKYIDSFIKYTIRNSGFDRGIAALLLYHAKHRTDDDKVLELKDLFKFTFLDRFDYDENGHYINWNKLSYYKDLEADDEFREVIKIMNRISE